MREVKRQWLDGIRPQWLEEYPGWGKGCRREDQFFQVLGRDGGGRDQAITGEDVVPRRLCFLKMVRT